MASLNVCHLIGNLTRDPEQRFLPSGKAVFVDQLLWLSGLAADLTAFGKQAETIAQYCRKGRPLYVQAKLRTEEWTDKGSGAKRSKLSLVVQEFQFLGGKDEAREDRQQTERPAPKTAGVPTMDLPPDDSDSVPF